MAKKASILLNLLQFTPKKIKVILSSFNDLDYILKATYSDFKEVSSLGEKDIEKILALRSSNCLDNELRLIEKEKIKCLDIFEGEYPDILRQISNPPLLLYIRGLSDVFNKFIFSIVGSRTPTAYGIRQASKFSHDLASHGAVIISGLARGIDTAAHKAALRCGETIAVLGSGLNNIYPRENANLAAQISQRGALVSEFPLGASPAKENFPRRNRIVSGLSRGVLVIEAAARSGASITAHLAAEQNREVFALPGNIDSPLSKGTNSLLKEGVKLVDCLDDILEEFPDTFKENINLSCKAHTYESCH